MSRRLSVAAIAASLTALALAATAAAAPPANDARAQAQVVASLPAVVTGTTVDATVERNDPRPFCDGVAATVWYRFDAPADGRLTLAFQATGDLDAVVAVYRRERSQLDGVTCERTDRRGRAGFAFAVERGESYLILIGQRANSAPGGFRLDLFQPEPEESLPGRRLPASGVSSTVDPLADPDDAWSTGLRLGLPYRVSLAPRGDTCPRLAIFRPGTGEADGPTRTLNCGGYRLIAPGLGEAGRWGLVVTPGPRRAGDSLGSNRQGYRLQVSPAEADDLAPGIDLGNDRPRSGSVNGRGVDRIDLYRFDLVRRSNLTLSLSGGDLRGVDLVLLGDNGRRYGTGSPIALTARPGRYLVAVRALSGGPARYVLRRLTREITSARTLVNGSRRTSVAPGATVTLSTAVRPSVPGSVTMTVERFDPLAGWLFARRFRLGAGASGVASVRWTPPLAGRWRVRGSFLGSRLASPSEGGTARLLVASPLGTAG